MNLRGAQTKSGYLPKELRSPQRVSTTKGQYVITRKSESRFKYVVRSSRELHESASIPEKLIISLRL